MKTHLLLTGVCGYVKDISDQYEDPLNQKVILFLSLLPVLEGRMVGVRNQIAIVTIEFLTHWKEKSRSTNQLEKVV